MECFPAALLHVLPQQCPPRVRAEDDLRLDVPDTDYHITSSGRGPETQATAAWILRGTAGVTLTVRGEGAPMDLIGLFGFKSGRDVDKLDRVPHRIGKAGCPLVTELVYPSPVCAFVCLCRIAGYATPAYQHIQVVDD